LTFGVLAAVAASSSASDDVTPGVLGFLVVAAMGVALFFLLRSMNKQFRKIAPKAEGTAGSEGSKPGQSETSAPDAPK
jgi:ABC-type sulfate transport system permease component